MNYVQRMIPLVFLIAGNSDGAQLLVNPGFESPVVTAASTCSGAGNAECFSQGASLGGWLVVGSGTASNSMLLLNNSYTEFGGSLHFTSQEGNQNLDLTGPGNLGANGVEQTVSTIAGTAYRLTFWVGNQDSAFAPYTSPSIITLLVNGTTINNYTNSANSSGNVNWAPFTFDFTAAGSSTTIRFTNATPSDNYAGLDNVSLVDVGSVPEPSTLALVLAGGLWLGLGRLRRHR
jgi:hypothetical protein